MKRRQIIILSAIAAVIILIVFALSGKKDKKGPVGSGPTETFTYVQTDQARIANHDLIIKGSGRLGSSRNVMLIAEVQGKLIPGQVNLKSGERFRKGQYLFGIDDTEAKLNMQSRKSNFLTMLATALPDLKIDFPQNFKRWEQFFESIDVTKTLPELPEIESVKEKTYLASKNILGEYYSIKAGEETLSRYRIYAPFDGNLVEVFTELGTVVNPGSQIARIIQSGNLEVEVPITVSEAHYLEVGQEVKVYVEGESQAARGEIIRIGEYINPNTQSVDVFVRVDKLPGMRLYDGMYVEVEINAGVLEEVVRVPRAAMSDDRTIWLVQDSFLISRPVKNSIEIGWIQFHQRTG